MCWDANDKNMEHKPDLKKKEGVEVLKKTKNHYLEALIRIPSLNQHNSSIEHTCFSALQIDVMLNIQWFKWYFYDRICWYLNFTIFYPSLDRHFTCLIHPSSSGFTWIYTCMISWHVFLMHDYTINSCHYPYSFNKTCYATV